MTSESRVTFTSTSKDVSNYEACSSVAERCFYMAEAGVRSLPRLPTSCLLTIVPTRPTRMTSNVAISHHYVADGDTRDVRLRGQHPFWSPRRDDQINPAVSADGPQYVIGPGDSLGIFVYRSPELSLEFLFAQMAGFRFRWSPRSLRLERRPAN